MAQFLCIDFPRLANLRLGSCAIPFGLSRSKQQLGQPAAELPLQSNGKEGGLCLPIIRRFVRCPPFLSFRANAEKYLEPSRNVSLEDNVPTNRLATVISLCNFFCQSHQEPYQTHLSDSSDHHHQHGSHQQDPDVRIRYFHGSPGKLHCYGTSVESEFCKQHFVHQQSDRNLQDTQQIWIDMVDD